MDRIEALHLPVLHDGVKVYQGVFYFDSDGLSHYRECRTSAELMHALVVYDVYKVRLLSQDGRVWEFEVYDSGAFAGCFQDDVITIEGEGEDDETDY